jgi:hypothetical protein
MDVVPVAVAVTATAVLVGFTLAANRYQEPAASSRKFKK